MRAQVWADPYEPAGDLAVAREVMSREGSMYDGGNNETRGTSQVTKLQLRIIALLLVPLALVLLRRYELI